MEQIATTVVSGFTPDAEAQLRAIGEQIVAHTSSTRILHLEGLLHLYALVCTISVVFLGLDKFRRGGVVALVSSWIDELRVRFAAEAEKMGFDERGWPQHLPELIRRYEETHAGVSMDSSPFILIEYLLLGDGEFSESTFNDPARLREAKKRYGCRFMAFFRKGGYIKSVICVFLVSLTIFYVLCLASAFPLLFGWISDNWLIVGEIGLFVWGPFNFLLVVVPAIILPKLDPTFERTIETLWNECRGRLKTLETANMAHEVITK